MLAGEPTAVKDPLEATEKTETVLAPLFATASKPPPGLKAADCGADPAPVVNGDPATGVNCPVGVVEKIDTSFPAELAVAASEPLGLKLIDCGLGPVANGEPDASVNTGCARATWAPDSQPAETSTAISSLRMGNLPVVECRSLLSWRSNPGPTVRVAITRRGCQRSDAWPGG